MQKRIASKIRGLFTQKTNKKQTNPQSDAANSERYPEDSIIVKAGPDFSNTLRQSNWRTFISSLSIREMQKIAFCFLFLFGIMMVSSNKVYTSAENGFTAPQSIFAAPFLLKDKVTSLMSTPAVVNKAEEKVAPIKEVTPIITTELNKLTIQQQNSNSGEKVFLSNDDTPALPSTNSTHVTRSVITSPSVIAEASYADLNAQPQSLEITTNDSSLEETIPDGRVTTIIDATEILPEVVETTLVITKDPVVTTTPVTTIEQPTNTTQNVAVDQTLSESESALMTEFRQLQKTSQSEGKLLLVKFTASWCVPCRVMEETVFVDQNVKSYLDENYLSLKVDIDDFDGYNLKQKYNVKKLPAILVLIPMVSWLRIMTKLLALLQCKKCWLVITFQRIKITLSQ